MGTLVFICILIAVNWGAFLLWKKRYLKKVEKNYQLLLRTFKLQEKKMFIESIHAAEKLVETEFAPLVFEHIGECYLELGNKTAATDAYKKALSLDNDLEFSYIGLGKIMLGDSKTDDAINSFKNALKIDSKNTVARYYLALAHEQKGDYESAIEELTAAKEINPTVMVVYEKLENLYLYLGKISEAEEIKKSIQILTESGN